MNFRRRFTDQISRALGYIFPRRKLAPPPRNILLLKPCCLGDVVLATSVPAALKYYYPQANIDVAVGRWSRAVLKNNPHIRKLIDTGRVGQGRYNLLSVWQLAQVLKQEQYDLVVTLDRSPVVGLIPWLAGIQHRVGLDSAGRGFAHTVRVAVADVPRHEAQIYLNAVFDAMDEQAEDEKRQFWTAFYPSPGDRESLPLLFDSPPNGNFVVLHPAGGVNPGMTLLDKRWPAANFAALADRFIQQGFQVVLSGVADDISLCNDIANKMTQPPPEILAGKLTLGQFGALCEQAALFVGGDTGAMHLAVASGCKTVAIFGPTDPKRYGPFAPLSQAIALWRPIELPQGGVGQGQAANFNWAQGVGVDEVWEACQGLLAGEQVGR